LKPDAPEFVPLHAKLDTEVVTPPTKEALKLQKKAEKEERKAASLGKKAGKKSKLDRPGMWGATDGGRILTGS
jgi:hypothetical protein